VTDTVPVRVRQGRDGEEAVLDAAVDSVLRDVLLEHGITPHGRYARRANCGGRGICATCGVRVLAAEGETAPRHWHDRLADRFGYPRLSCQLRVEAPMTVAVLPGKRVWGGRE